MSPVLKNCIIQGKDVNLALLLVAPNDLGELRQLDIIVGEVFLKHVSAESRFKRNLVLSEFIVAFTKYKNIMCEAYPYRRVELDMYERDIIEMATRYGGTTFYEYHKAFSARAAAMLEQRNIKIDWSVRDNKLFCSLFAGSRIVACEICSSISHPTELCAQLVRPMNINHGNQRSGKLGLPAAIHRINVIINPNAKELTVRCLCQIKTINFDQ